MYPSLGDNNNLWHSPISPLQMRQWYGWSNGGAVSTKRRLHNLVHPPVEVFVPSRLDFWICRYMWYFMCLHEYFAVMGKCSYKIVYYWNCMWTKHKSKDNTNLKQFIEPIWWDWLQNNGKQNVNATTDTVTAISISYVFIFYITCIADKYQNRNNKIRRTKLLVTLGGPMTASFLPSALTSIKIIT